MRTGDYRQFVISMLGVVWGIFPIGGVVPMEGGILLETGVGPAGLEGGTSLGVEVWIVTWRADGDGFDETAGDG